MSLMSTQEISSQAADALAVNLEDGWVLMDDDTTALIDIWLDSYGCDTEDENEAVVVVARLCDGPNVGKWIVVDLRAFVKSEIS